ncbi:MAG: HEAT repeat domain-containing protein [Leptolyngbya sp. DLM2.Bin15]|nr:MAG: HEAT repeat domain-containing protein [Leptolyngbya sp. DLM2.Bin15]
MTLPLSPSSNAQALIQAVEQATSPVALLLAVRSLAELRSVDAIPTLIQVLGYNNPGAAVAAVDGLVNLGDLAAPVILEQIDGYNYGARAWAIRALSRIGHPDALDTLTEAARQDFSLSVRRAAAKGLGTLRWAVLPPDQQRPVQMQTLETLTAVCGDGEWVVRYAAIAGLQALAAVLEPADPAVADIQRLLQQQAATDDTLAVQARALWALQAIAPDSNA